MASKKNTTNQNSFAEKEGKSKKDFPKYSGKLKLRPGKYETGHTNNNCNQTNSTQTGNSPRPHRRIFEEGSYSEHKTINRAHHTPNRPHKKISPWKEKSLATPNWHRRYWRYQPFIGRIILE